MGWMSWNQFGPAVSDALLCDGGRGGMGAVTNSNVRLRDGV